MSREAHEAGRTGAPGMSSGEGAIAFPARKEAA